MLEINENGTSNALTTVQKDNVVVIPVLNKIENWYKEEGKIVEDGDIIQTGQTNMKGDRIYKTGISPTLPAENPRVVTVLKSNEIVIPANHSKGYDIAEEEEEEEEEDSINFSNPNSETRRGRVGHGISQTLDTACNQGILSQQRIRRLTPLECFRLMDFNENFKWDVSDSQAYKQAGNSICVGVLTEIISKLKL